MAQTLKTVFSGIQPTGNVHLGNYLGSIRNWIDLQDSYNCLFGIMNLHAITTPQNPDELKKNVYDIAAIYIGCGLDPDKSIIFVQSDVSYHLELTWILSCITPLGWLNRMTQFKEKSKENENLGLYSYPVLMASDILLYHADIVPVGHDQKQHIELARDIANSFNRIYKNEFFKIPEPMIVNNVKRIMSLQDGTKKMSKSDSSELSRINVLDSADEIVKKIKKSKTDSLIQIDYVESRPELYNLINIFSAMSKEDPKSIQERYSVAGYSKFKNDLAEIIVEKLRPIQYNINKLRNDQLFLSEVIKNGNIKAQEIAKKTKEEVYRIIGLH